jgi:hypothetical protein
MTYTIYTDGSCLKNPRRPRRLCRCDLPGRRVVYLYLADNSHT